MELYRDISLLSARSKDDRSVSSLTNVTRDKYRTMPDITPEEMLQGYVSSPRRHLTTSERQPRFVAPPPSEVTRPDYCTLCFEDHHSSSAWVKYNERRVEQLQRRIDLMLQIDDNEEADMLLTRSVYPTTVATVSQRIDDILLRKTQYRSPLLFPPDRIGKFTILIFPKISTKPQGLYFETRYKVKYFSSCNLIVVRLFAEQE